MAQISNNRTQIINKLMRRFNLSQQQLLVVIAVVILGIVSVVVFIGMINAGTSESFDRSHNQANSTQSAIVAENPQHSQEDKITEQPGDDHKIKEASPQMMVHVDGAVKSPGLYALQMVNPRVNDAIQIAGGLTEDANSQGINLAASVEDGQKIYIPRKGEEAPPEISQPDQNKVTSNKQTDKKSDKKTVININRATVEEFTKLHGVGEGLAKRIVADRQKNGPFKTTEDLMRVSGIGQKKFDQLKDNIRV